MKKELPKAPAPKATESRPVSPYEPGQLVPGSPYRVERILGSGGMGSVLLACDENLDARRVLKMPHVGLIKQHPDLRARFQSEAKTVSRLRHRNIIQVFSFGITDDEYKLPYFVMEYLEGQDVRTVLRKGGRLSVHETLNLAIEVLDGLHCAHLSGVVHRDLKPENVFIERGHPPCPRIIDFGLSGNVGTNTNYFQGTWAYAAPEQFTKGAITSKTDIYAVGVMLWEILVGRTPFAWADYETMRAAHLATVPARVSTIVPIPAELDELIALMMEKDPEDRPKSAYWLGSRLRAILAGSDDHPIDHQIITHPDTMVRVLEHDGVSAPHLSQENTPIANYAIPTFDLENSVTSPETPQWLLDLWKKEDERKRTLDADDEARIRLAPTRTMPEPVVHSKLSPSMAARETASADPNDNTYMESPLSAARAMAVSAKPASLVGKVASRLSHAWKNGVLPSIVAGAAVSVLLFAVYYLSVGYANRYLVKNAKYGDTPASSRTVGASGPAAAVPSSGVRKEPVDTSDASTRAERAARAGTDAK